VIQAPIDGPIRHLRDLYAVFFLPRLFRERRFNIMDSVTPRGGMRSMIAAWVAPRRSAMRAK